MGGFRSGRWQRTDPKGTVGSNISIDIRGWSREGLLRDGSEFDVSWMGAQNFVEVLTVRISADRAHLRYRYVRLGGSELKCRYMVDIEWTPCHLGGKRPWFQCPGCGKRAARLYCAAEIFKCRRCHNLVYATQRLTPFGRTLRRAQRIRQKLGGSPNIATTFPKKPKRMRWFTYLRLYDQAREAESVVVGHLKALL
jgi:hypothetical protein